MEGGQDFGGTNRSIETRMGYFSHDLQSDFQSDLQRPRYRGKNCVFCNPPHVQTGRLTKMKIASSFFKSNSLIYSGRNISLGRKMNEQFTKKRHRLNPFKKLERGA